MRNGIYVLILFVPVFLLSCNRSANKAALGSGDNYKLIDSPEQCFIAVYQKDSAFLKFKTRPKGKIMGRLVIKYAEIQPDEFEKEFYHGEIIGQFKNDTLFADYIFADGTKTAVYRNPIALLKKSQKLVLGFGAIENYLGKTWFINHKAINFNRSRFQFLPIACDD